MTVCSALIALSLLLTPSQEQTGAFTVNGKTVPIRLVSTPAPTPPEEFLTWDGWQYLAGKEVLPGFTPFPALTDWSQVLREYEANKDQKGVPWRTKVYLITSTESLGKDSNGVLRMNRDILSDEQIQSALESIARLKAIVTAQTRGKVDLQLDVTVERDPLFFPSYGPDFANWYIAPRINGGLYEADDKVFRGPYHGAIYILPGYATSNPEPSVVNGTPVDGVQIDRQSLAIGGGNLEYWLERAWNRQVKWRTRSQGFRGIGTPPGDDWSIIATLEEPSAEAINSRLRASKDASASLTPVNKIDNLWKAPGTEVAIVADAERGKVLKVSEKLGIRQGGVALPTTSGLAISTIDATPTLSFFAKATDRDPISIHVYGKEKSFWISLGRDPILAEPTDAVVGSMPFEANNQWQQISVDLRPLAKATGVTEILAFTIEPTPNALKADIVESASADYFFDDFKLSADPAQPFMPAPTADLASTDPESRALGLAQATASSPATIALLKDPWPVVRLNATALYTRVTDPAAESALAANVSDFQPLIQAMAVQALARLGTDSAKATLRNVVKYTLGDYVKSQAAAALAATGDTKYTGDILTLLTSNSWQTAISTVNALAKANPGAPQARHVFLRANDPAVRLAVIELADAKVSTDRSALQWHALNDPSDKVRATANYRLIASGDPALAAEGYKGIRDDSRYARIILLQLLEANPSAAHKPAILTALTDKSAAVRVAAIHALGTQPGTPTVEELGGVLSDLYPDVQLAVAELAAAKNIKLSAATVQALKDSPSKAVQEAAAKLPS